MGFVEIIYKDHSGIRLENNEMKDFNWDYCGTCRELVDGSRGSSELGTFICYKCLGTPNGQSA